MQFDHGWISPYFVTDRAKMEAVLENAQVLLTDRRISSMPDLLPLLERIAQQGRPLLVIAEDVEGEALATLVVNKLRGTLPCCAVKAPGFGDRRKDMLEDIGIMVGAQVVSEALGQRLDKLGPEILGHADRVVVDRDHTTLIGGRSERATLEARRQQLRNEIHKTTSDYDREKLEERLARLSGGVAVIRVGAPSEAEMRNRKEALDDAISATRAAVAEGLVPGGGLALLRCTVALEKLEATCEGDERTGVQILKQALEAPARQIAENSAVDGGVVVDRMRTGTGNMGFDAARKQYVDLVAEGIVDPTKVVRIALENAVSVASVLLLTEATMTEIPESAKAPEPALA
jgi:chaperonin GroEL